MSFDLRVYERLFTTSPREIVAGFRLCRIVQDEGGTISLAGLGVGNDYLYSPGWNRATCTAEHRREYTQSEAVRRHLAPGAGCTCGLYACTSLSTLFSVVGVGTPHEHVLVGVLGTGGLDIAERGWRAQYSRVVAVSREHISRVVFAPDGTVVRMTRRAAADSIVLDVVSQRYRASLVSLSELESIVNLQAKYGG